MNEIPYAETQETRKKHTIQEGKGGKEPNHASLLPLAIVTLNGSCPMECNGSIFVKCKTTFGDNSIGMCHAGIPCRSQFQFLNICDRYIQRSRIRRNGFNIENGLAMILQGMVPGSRGGGGCRLFATRTFSGSGTRTTTNARDTDGFGFEIIVVILFDTKFDNPTLVLKHIYIYGKNEYEFLYAGCRFATLV